MTTKSEDTIEDMQYQIKLWVSCLEQHKRNPDMVIYCNSVIDEYTRKLQNIQDKKELD
jgi:hypothetical protein